MIEGVPMEGMPMEGIPESTTMTIAIHFILSIIPGFVLALSIRHRSVGLAMLIGIVFGLVIYAVNFCRMTAVFPWFAKARHWVSILSHVMFGAVPGWSYAARAHRGHAAHRAH